jgi:hypothetical protein
MSIMSDEAVSAIYKLATTVWAKTVLVNGAYIPVATIANQRMAQYYQRQPGGMRIWD